VSACCGVDKCYKTAKTCPSPTMHNMMHNNKIAATKPTQIKNNRTNTNKDNRTEKTTTKTPTHCF